MRGPRSNCKPVDLGFQPKEQMGCKLYFCLLGRRGSLSVVIFSKFPTLSELTVGVIFGSRFLGVNCAMFTACLVASWYCCYHPRLGAVLWTIQFGRKKLIWRLCLSLQSLTCHLFGFFTELSGVLHQCHVLASEMVHFIHQMQYYITFEVYSIHPNCCLKKKYF